jgi:membrane protein YqaA with SNARE-associated domain
MEMPLIIAMMGLLGVLVGALFQYFLTRRMEDFKQKQSIRNLAYTDFIKAICGLSISTKNKNEEKMIEFTILLADAKGRISIYGGKNVVNKVVVFF